MTIIKLLILMEIALYQPDIPQNTGTIMRLCACLDVPLHIIEPCGFAFGEAKMRRAVMDYYDKVKLSRHLSWQAFLDFAQSQPKKRVVLLSTHAKSSYAEFTFTPDDILLFGRESAGVPQEVREAADAYIRIPVSAGTRSLNVAVAASMVLGEGLRQTKLFPKGL
jgi:tRNA (cytidine/uridine-2'-O-)-methyltransferase